MALRQALSHPLGLIFLATSLLLAAAMAWLPGLDRWSEERWAEAEREVRVEAAPGDRPRRPGQPNPNASPDAWLGRRRGWLK